MKNQIIWKTNINYVDVETGEVLSEYLAKTKYIIINTIKNGTTINPAKTCGTVSLTKQCTRNPQIEIFGTDTY